MKQCSRMASICLTVCATFPSTWCELARSRILTIGVGVVTMSSRGAELAIPFCLLIDFPSADYPGLFPEIPEADGRYRIAHWWYTLFERHWSLRGMSDALMDFYTDPESVHRLYDALTTFYCRMIERAHEEVGADAVYSTDDIGTQTGLLFTAGNGITGDTPIPSLEALFDEALTYGTRCR